MAIKALLLTLLVGIFFALGIFMLKLFKNKNILNSLTTGITFVIMLYLIFFDLLPEINEIFHPFKRSKYMVLILIFAFLGYTLLKLLDLFVPQHHHRHREKEDNLEEHNNHLFHIGLITAVSLILHNLLEGITIYATGLTDLKLGLLMAISVGCHNFPLGIEVAASMDASNHKKFTKYLILFFLIISSSLGAFTLYVLGIELNTMIEGILLSITLGMLVYISMFELYPEIKRNKNNKEIKTGLKIGFILSILLFLL